MFMLSNASQDVFLLLTFIYKSKTSFPITFYSYWDIFTVLVFQTWLAAQKVFATMSEVLQTVQLFHFNFFFRHLFNFICY